MAEPCCWDVEEESFGWGRQPSRNWDWSKTKKHPAHLMFQNHIAPSHSSTTWPCFRPREWLNQFHQAAQAATRKIQITKISPTFHAVSETPQWAPAVWGSLSSPIHSHLEHQSPAAAGRHRWQHSRIHHNHYAPLESKLKVCLHHLGLYPQMVIL